MTEYDKVIDRLFLSKNISDIKYNINNLLDNYKTKNIDKYVLLIAHNIYIQKLFILYILYFVNDILEQKTYISIDFEFNKGKIALMQLNFSYLSNKLHNILWVIDPRDLYIINSMHLFINNIILNGNIYKIFHGADSLDIPYIYNFLLKGNKDNILKFMTKFIDTRLLCEYFRTSIGERKNCGIYDGLLAFGVINNKIYDSLNAINASLGPIHKVDWSIKNFNSPQIQYAYYDVYYLTDFFFAILQKANKITPNLIESYKYLPHIIRLIYLNKKGTVDLIQQLKHKNSQFIMNMDNNKILEYKFLDEANITIPELGFNLTNIKNIDYIKNDFMIIIRYLLLCKINHKQPYYLNDILINIKMKKLIDLFKSIYDK